MEMNMRDWMIVIGVLLFLLVVLDGYRRAQRERKNQVRMNRKAEKQRFDYDEPTISELPNGGNKRLISEQSFVETDSDHNDPLFNNPFEREAASIVEDELQTLEQSESLADEPVETKEQPAQAPDITDEPEPIAALNTEQETVEVEDLSASIDEAAGNTLTTEFKSKPADEPISDDFDELIMMHVVSQSKAGFRQSEVMDILQQCDMRLSASSIYERFELADGRGAVQFRVANATKSGQFMMNEDDDSLSGITLFLQLPGPEQAFEAFEAMVAVAQCVASNLNGSLKDELLSTMTEQTLQHCRQRIKDYLQQRLVKHG